MVTAVFERFLCHRVVQLVIEATRAMSGVEPSGLYHFYSNQPDHMSEIQVHYRGSSDHRLVIGTCFTKSAIGKTRIIKKNSFKNFDPNGFIEALKTVSVLSL